MRMLLVVCAVVLSGSCWAQDQWLTQHNRLASWINPARTADIPSDYRIQSAYRNQWPSLQAPYTTSFVQGEIRAWEAGYEPHYLGVGLTVVHDQAGNKALNHFEVHGATALSLATNDYNHFAFGLQGGYIRRTLNDAALRWDSQYNGVGYDPSLDSGESLAGVTLGHIDLAAGISWKHQKKANYRIGYAVFHSMQNRTLLIHGEDPYAMRHTLTGEFAQRLRKVEFNYSLLYMRQAGAQVIAAGAVARIGYGQSSRYTTHQSSSALISGLYLRVAGALTPVVGLRYKQYGEVTLSYDVTISSLKKVVAYRGGWEVHLRYDGFFTDRRRRLK